MRRRAWAWLLVLLSLGLWAAHRFHQGTALQSDMLAMLPATEQRPRAEEALKRLAEAGGERAVMLLGHGDPATARTAAETLAADLEASRAFRHVLGRLPAVDPTQVPRFYAPYRFALPGPALEDPATQLQTRLASPQGAVGGLDPGQDPLGRVETFLAGQPLNALNLEFQDGFLATRRDDLTWVLVSATLEGSSFDQAVQTRSLEAIRAARTRLDARIPGLRHLSTGGVFYAEEARSGAEREMNLVSSLSMAGIALLYLLLFRTLRHMALGLFCVGGGLVLALGTSLLLYGQLHLLTLVCGASVLGGAVDFSSHYFAHHQGAGRDWHSHAALRRHMKPLALAFGTTLLGYAALMGTPFPALRQIAVFTALGLAGAFLTVILVVPDALKAPAPDRPILLRRLRRSLAWLHTLAQRRGVPLAAGLAVLGLAALCLPLQVQDQASALMTASPALQAQERRIQALTGLSLGQTFFLVEGPDEATVLAREEALRARLEPRIQDGMLQGVQAVSASVPSPQAQARTLAAQRAAFPALRDAMTELGFRPEVTRRLEDDLDSAAGRVLKVEDWLAQPFSQPSRFLWMNNPGQPPASLVLPLGTPEPAAMAEAAAQVPGVSYVDKARSVGLLLGRFRTLAQGALVLALLGVWAVLAPRYGARGAFWVTLPAAFGVLLPLAGLALAGMPLTLFGVLALILTLGFSVDYTIFLREGRLREAATLLGVLLAAASTFLSYALLVFSRTPVLASFGLVIALGVLGSFLSAFLALRGRPRGI